MSAFNLDTKPARAQRARLAQKLDALIVRLQDVRGEMLERVSSTDDWPCKAIVSVLQDVAAFDMQAARCAAVDLRDRIAYERSQIEQGREP